MKRLIRHAGKKLGIDLGYFISASLWTSIPTFGELFTNIITAVVFARVLGAEAYGQYQFFLSVLIMLSLFALTGNSGAIIPSVSKGHDRSLSDATRTSMLFSLFGSLVAASIATYYLLTHNVLASGFFVAAVFFPFLYSTKSYIAFLIGKEQFKLHAQLYTAQIIFVNAGLLIAVLITRTAVTAMAAYVLLWSTSSLALYAIVKYRFRAAIKRSRKDMHLRSYSIHLTLMQITLFISANLDKVIIAYYLGFTAVALYTVAQNIAQLNQLALKPILRIILPRFSQQKTPHKTYDTIRRRLLVFFGFSAIICAANAFATPFVIRTFFTQEYYTAILYAQILTIAYVTTFASALFQNYLIAHQWTGSLYKVFLVSGIVKVGLLFALIPFFGIWGVIAAFIAGSGMEFIISFYYSSVETRKITL